MPSRTEQKALGRPGAGPRRVSQAAQQAQPAGEWRAPWPVRDPDATKRPEPVVPREKKRLAFILSLIGATIVLSVWSLATGSIDCGPLEVIKALIPGRPETDLSYLIVHLRLPRLISALAVGGILALNGAVLQNVLANPLASSFTLGITQGAAFGACLAMIVLPVGATAHVSLSLVALCAFCGSILTSLAVMSFSLLRGMTPQGLILAGVAISALLGAGTMSLQYFASDVQVVSTMFWTFGDLGRGGWQESAITMSLFLVWLALAIFLAWDFEALKWGETQAQALGINTRRLRFFSLLLTALTTAAATAFFGVIGFVGLIGPHMVRLAFPRAGYMFLLPCAALFGGTFIIAADLLARTMLYPLVLPIGIICAFAGVPMFLFLLFKSAMSYA